MVSLQIVKRCMTHAGDVPDVRLTGEDEPEDGASAETEQILANVRPGPLSCRSSVWTSCAALLYLLMIPSTVWDHPPQPDLGHLSTISEMWCALQDGTTFEQLPKDLQVSPVQHLRIIETPHGHK